MNKGLGWKLIVIVVVVLLFAYGIFGIPAGFSGGALADGLLSPGVFRNGIHLGLDLKGGTHLILQVQVADAINAESDSAVETLNDGLRKAKIDYADITKPDPTNHPEQILIKGVPSTAEVRPLVDGRLPDYESASGPNQTWTVTMKPTSVKQTEDHAVTQAIETIRNRIDQLGVAEPVIEEHGLGQHQILVQLPGVDDPARVEEIIKSTAMLEIKQSVGGPYPSQEAALQDHNGVLPADSMLMQGHGVPGAEGEQWYLVSRVSAVRGKDPRDAVPSRDQGGQPSVSFTLTNEGGRPWRDQWSHDRAAD